MSKLQKSKSQIFIDYVPAELRENKTWIVVYYVKNPVTGVLEIKRNRVKPLKSIKQRRLLAKVMVDNINDKLRKDPNSFFIKKGVKEFTLFSDAVNVYLSQLKRELKDKNLSEDTYKTYLSKVNNIKQYISYSGFENFYCHNLDNDFVVEHLDYLRYEKNNSARTRDNYYTFYVTLAGWLIKKKYISENPCDGLSKINKRKTEKQTISEKDRNTIFNYYSDTNTNFLVFCLCCYYCLVRRTELSKLKVSDVDLKNRTLWVSSEDSKNNKSSHVTIPSELYNYISEHIKNSSKEDYLFSNDNYATGPERFKPNKATNNWRRMRKKIKINQSVKWYNLKDTGIVDLIIKGVPLNSVRDQARHHNIFQTNDYIPRNMKTADNFILNSGVKFTKD